MKCITKLFELENGKVKYGMLSIALFIVVILVALIIHILGWLWSLTGIGIGTFEGWLSFWGSFIGGIMSGLLTLIGVYLAFKLEGKKSLVQRYHAVTSELIDFEEWLETNTGIIETRNEHRDIHFDNSQKIKDEGKQYEVAASKLDVELYDLIKEYNYNLAWFYLNLEMTKSDDEMNSEYANKHIGKDIIDVKKYSEKIINRLNFIKEEAS